MSQLRQQFIEFSVNAGVLRFGEFVTKAGRHSPYFFNAGSVPYKPLTLPTNRE